jgi:hypothetical protein
MLVDVGRVFEAGSQEHQIGPEGLIFVIEHCSGWHFLEFV